MTLKPKSTSDSAQSVTRTSDTKTAAAAGSRKRQCPYCQAANKDLKESWKQIESLKAELATLRGDNGTSDESRLGSDPEEFGP
jgi:hypothetical protein